MKSILVVDDEETFNSVLSELLQEEGFSVASALNGREGIEALQQHQFDLVITDLIMPDVDGIEVIMHVKKNHANTKLIAISGGGKVSSRDYLGLAKSFGAEIILDKPIDLEDLLDHIKILIK
ncbi:MAG: response regulator [Gammaproteobacteria bacterium]|nr:response regulator [Gammaproteobacteria bacterium]MDH5727894.1 response regulator [Gammaproteobacteria bacterium]